MKALLLLSAGLSGISGLSGGLLAADDSIESLRQELQTLRDRTEQLEHKLQGLEQAALTNRAAPVPPGPPPQPAGDPVRPAPTAKYLNVSLSVLGAGGGSTAEDVESLQLGGHDPRQRGFTLQNAELTLEGKIDPYLRGQANTVFLLTPDGETEVELEEAYLESLSLPANLQLRAGQFLSEFGRINASHPHTWDFVDAPLVTGRFFGGDGLRGPGARVSWLAPTPYYSELFLAVQNSQGETAHSFRSDHEGGLFFGRPADPGRLHSVGDLLFVPRYALSFDLTDTQTLLAGASAAFAPNSSGAGADTQVYGADLFWKWKSARQHGGFPFVTWQTEALLRRFQAGAFDGDPADPSVLPLPAETIADYGFYSQIAYGFRKAWVAALRGDYVAPETAGEYEALLGPDLARARRWRLSPNLTWYPSEFSKVRLQYNYDYRTRLGGDHSVWLQFEFLLGAHAAHKF